MHANVIMQNKFGYYLFSNIIDKNYCSPSLGFVFSHGSIGLNPPPAGEDGLEEGAGGGGGGGSGGGSGGFQTLQDGAFAGQPLPSLMTERCGPPPWPLWGDQDCHLLYVCGGHERPTPDPSPPLRAVRFPLHRESCQSVVVCLTGPPPPLPGSDGDGSRRFPLQTQYEDRGAALAFGGQVRKGAVGGGGGAAGLIPIGGFVHTQASKARCLAPRIPSNRVWGKMLSMFLKFLKYRQEIKFRFLEKA